VRWNLDDLDFPVLVLRHPPGPPALTGLGGSDSHGLVSVGIGYAAPGSGNRGPALETLVRRGHRLTPTGGVTWVGTDLADLATHAVRALLLAHLSAQGAGEEPGLPARVEELQARARTLGGAAPSAPWRLVAADVDGTPFALWLAELDEGFAAVLDWGPVMLTASGPVTPQDWGLAALSADAVRAVLGSPAGRR
jgi:hypothetical protein